MYSEITDESTRYEIFKGHVDFFRQSQKSVLQFESDRVFDQQNSDFVSQNAGYKPSNVQGWPRVRVESQLADRVQVFCRGTTGSEEKSQKLRSPRGSVLMCVIVRTLCLLVSSVTVILSVARAVIHDMLHLMVCQGCDPF